MASQSREEDKETPASADESASTTMPSSFPASREENEKASMSIIDEMINSVALSTLIFLLADMRLMSATGRSSTTYQTIALDCDYAVRATAEQLAGIETNIAFPLNNTANEGLDLSPAHLMAVVMVELKKELDAKNRNAHMDSEEEFDQKSLDKTRAEMDSLLQAYSDMIGNDLNEKIPHIEARRSILNLISPDDDDETQRLQQQFTRPFERANERRKSMFLGDKSMAKLQREEVTDAVFQMGETRPSVRQSLAISGKRKLSDEELLHFMTRAVESRVYGKLAFMEHFFRDGTISQKMVTSPVRIVWMNDWYTSLDLIYAIAVDTERKRVMIIFRGCTTAQDWSKAIDYHLKDVPNPIPNDFEGKGETIRVHGGFYQYLFRVRKDTGTNKFDEIANMAHKYGLERIGQDYTLFVTGYSLGAALATVFGFYASIDPRFTRNGPVKAFVFASPYVGGNSFAECFRYQEKNGKLICARFYNNNDTVAHLPANFGVRKRFRHVGVSIKVPPVPRWFSSRRKWKPTVYYAGDEGRRINYFFGIGRNVLLHTTPKLWKIAEMHGLAELQKRVMEGRMREDGLSEYEVLLKPIEVAYEELVGMSTTSGGGGS